MKSFFKKEFLLLVTISISLVYFFIAVKLNMFRYNNFDYGKFDLGNMTQMVWNASKGNGLWLTDYFGTNLPRWAMSHVDPILFILVPFFILFPHPLTLVIFQLIMVIFSSVLVYLISKLVLKNKWASFFLSLTFLFNPAIGYLTAFTGFHGVTAVIPYFLLAFYIFERMYVKENMNTKGIVLMWFFLILTMMGKEQIPLYTFFFGFYILILRNDKAKRVSELFKTNNGKLAISIMLVSVVWFITAFFIIIPNNAHYRIEGYKKFAESMGISESAGRDVAMPNYFLNRYEGFGESYSEIAFNIVTQPQKAINVFFSGDKLKNFNRTFAPFGYLPFLSPLILLMAIPDMSINYLTTAGGIGTSEIENHRVSMLLPVLMIATIYSVLYISKLFEFKIKPKIVSFVLSLLVFLVTLYTSHAFNNPIYLWTSEAVIKRVLSIVHAKNADVNELKDLEIGSVIKLSELEDKDRECALKIVNTIPDGVSVSGPDSLGSHLAQRETYAIFPALFDEADYVIVDVFSRKLLTILDLRLSIVHDVVSDLIKSEFHELEYGCGNYFVFKKVGAHDKDLLLPIQEKFNYDEKFNLYFFHGLYVVDYDFPDTFIRGVKKNMHIAYRKGDPEKNKNEKLDDFVLFTSFVNKETLEIYQFANLPSYSLRKPESWRDDNYYLESIEVTVPSFVDPGDYYLFVGMGNKIRTRSMYLGGVSIK